MLVQILGGTSHNVDCQMRRAVSAFDVPHVARRVGCSSRIIRL
jgi:hypothetical protein